MSGSVSPIITLISCFLLALLLLPTLVVFTTIKELRKNIRVKVFACYLTSMIGLNARQVFVTLPPNDPEVIKYRDLTNAISIFFVISTFLWLNVMGYEVWICFKQSNLTKDSHRFIWYSIYVWGISLVLAVIQFLHLETIWVAGITIASLILIMTFNLITFVIIAVQVCKTRCRVKEMKHETNPNCRTVSIILRLFFIMGIPRVLLDPLFGALFNPMAFVEALLIFAFFVMKRDVRNLLKARCCRCCQRRKDPAVSSVEIM